MKKFTSSIFIFFFFASFIFAQDVEQVQRTLITKRTATWCGNCGSWGWQMFKHLLDENEGNAVLLAAHHSGDLHNSVAEAITDNFTSFSQPRFFLNHTDQNASSGNWSSVAGDMKTQIDNAFQNQNPIANVGFTVWEEPTDGTLGIQAKVKFFEDADGEFYLGIYLVENNIISFQASQGNNANHAKVLRAAFSNSAFGIPITSGSVNQGQEFSFIPDDFNTMNLVPTANHEFVGIIWKKVGANYEVVNVQLVEETEVNVSNVTEVDAGLATFNISPNPANSIAQLELNLFQKVEAMELSIFDASGKMVWQVGNGDFEKGTHHFQIQKSQVGASGQYFVRLKIGNQVSTKNLIFN